VVSPPDNTPFSQQAPSNNLYPDPSSQPKQHSAPAPKESATHGAYRTKKERAKSHVDVSHLDVLADYEQRVAAAGERAQDEHIDVLDFVHPREKFYGTLSFVIGIIVYSLSGLFLIGLAIAPLMILSAYIISGIHYGSLRSRGIRVSNEQFPEVYEFVEKHCTLMHMEIPEIFVIQEHGLLNAFAQRLHRRNMITICSDVLELAYEHGEKELAFVVVHELTHLKRGHVKWAWLHLPASAVPFLGNAYSRGCEYTCDRVASYLVPDGALYGLVALAAGTKLYKRVNIKALYEQQERDWDFWTWYHEITSTHPNLVNRIRAIGISDEVATFNFAHR
jgi:Zn-dependent protease with chaperone function